MTSPQAADARPNPPCQFVEQTGAPPCGDPSPRALEGRALCDAHIMRVLQRRVDAA